MKILAFLILSSACFASTPSYVGYVGSTGVSATSGTSFTVSYTTSANYAKALLLLSGTHFGSASVTAASFAGNSFRPITINAHYGAARGLSFFYMTNVPDSYTGNVTITVGTSISSPGVTSILLEYSGVDQSVPIPDYNTNLGSGGSTSALCSLTTTVSSSALISYGTGGGGTWSIPTGFFRRIYYGLTTDADINVSGDIISTFPGLYTAIYSTSHSSPSSGLIEVQAAPTPTLTVSPTPTFTATPTFTVTLTVTPTVTKTSTATPTATPSITVTPIATWKPRATPVPYPWYWRGF